LGNDQGNRMKGTMKSLASGCGRILRESKSEIARIRGQATMARFRQKTGFFRWFSEAESRDVGDFWAKTFPQALISNWL